MNCRILLGLLFLLVLVPIPVMVRASPNCYVYSLKVYFPSTAYANEQFTTQTQAGFSCEGVISFNGLQVQIIDERNGQILSSIDYMNPTGILLAITTAPNRTGPWIAGVHVSAFGYVTTGETAASQAIVLMLDPAMAYNATGRENGQKPTTPTTIPPSSPNPCGSSGMCPPKPPNA